jgi:ABC-2 type transport system ATP-binding protein
MGKDMKEHAVEISGLVKRFGETLAVDGLDLAVDAGSVYGVLGPNGAGKTTTIRILATLLLPDGGMARVMGHDVVEDAALVRRWVGLTGQFASVDADMTGQENLILVARLIGMKRTTARERAGELLEVFGLEGAGDRRVATYSGGMRRRLDVAASLVAAPDVLFLDEPTTGLDPRSRSQVWEIVQRLVAGGTTVLLTTQYLDEADRLADRIALIDQGRMVAEGSSAELKASVGAATLHISLQDAGRSSEAERILRETLGSAPHVAAQPGSLLMPVAEPETAAVAIARLFNADIPVKDFSLDRPSLDEVFLALTGRPAHTGQSAAAKKAAA